jgi:hypothetical protein
MIYRCLLLWKTCEKICDMSVSTKQHETLLHQQPQQQVTVRKQRKGIPPGFNHQQGDGSKFSIGSLYGTLEWAKKSLNLDSCQYHPIEDMKRAYNQRILATHPDKNMDASNADCERFGEEFREARVAWNILKRGNAINKISRPTITTTQYANNLKKNLESFVTLEIFLKELTQLHGPSVAGLYVAPIPNTHKNSNHSLT